MNTQKPRQFQQSMALPNQIVPPYLGACRNAPAWPLMRCWTFELPVILLFLAFLFHYQTRPPLSEPLMDPRWTLFVRHQTLACLWNEKEATAPGTRPQASWIEMPLRLNFWWHPAIRPGAWTWWNRFDDSLVISQKRVGVMHTLELHPWASDLPCAFGQVLRLALF